MEDVVRVRCILSKAGDESDLELLEHTLHENYGSVARFSGQKGPFSIFTKRSIHRWFGKALLVAFPEK
ncbi:hypothetical protein [Flagellimonas olearia]|uniref:hypothetical protein n=1 Tax=Flagellimonas olearia TaxID=552546 RepID=UPI001B86683E|nr:hypothetical protein [Allomuricauda olearia]